MGKVTKEILSNDTGKEIKSSIDNLRDTVIAANTAKYDKEATLLEVTDARGAYTSLGQRLNENDNKMNNVFDNLPYKSKVSMICMKQNGSGNCFIIEFANGKNMFIDTGSSVDWQHIVSTLEDMNVSYFDYGVITHPHNDHVGNLQNFITNYCDENTIFYIGATPDFTKIPNEQTSYENMLTIFSNNNITPIVPVNNSVITIDELSKTSVRFLNTDTSWFEDYYYPNAIGEYRTDSQTANVLSLVTEITFNNVKFLETGDIEKCVEDKLVNYISKINLMTTPHHFSNKHMNEQFYNNLDADTYFVSTSNGSLSYSNSGYIKAMREHKNIISSYQATFDVVTATTYGYNFEFSKTNYKSLYIPKLYNNVANLISSEHYITSSSNISLEMIITNMGVGDILNCIIYSDFTTLKNDLKTVFNITDFPNESILEITKNGGTMYKIKLLSKDKRLSFEAHTNNSGTNWYCEGYGTVGSWTNETQLLALLNTLPVGVYSLYYNGNEDHTLGATPQYQTLNINQITSTGYRKGIITGVRNNTAFAMFVGNFTGAADGFSWKQVTLS